LDYEASGDETALQHPGEGMVPSRALQLEGG
jgi:hypothetical protein